jgi:hypothetical protein
MRHIARNCPQVKDQDKTRKFKRHQAHFTGEDEPGRKIIKEDDPDELYLM